MDLLHVLGVVTAGAAGGLIGTTFVFGLVEMFQASRWLGLLAVVAVCYAIAIVGREVGWWGWQ